MINSWAHAWNHMPATGRRTFIVTVAAIITFIAYLIVGMKDTFWGVQVSRGQAVWIVLSAQIVGAVYKWGVGGWSRYDPPPETHMKDAPSQPSDVPGHA